MSYETPRGGTIDYALCRYGNSKLRFRGPPVDLSVPYIAMLGGTETFGKFVETPFVKILDRRLSLRCANFGYCNAGVDVALNDPVLPGAATGAALTVLQVPGAQNLSNRHYTVHPRRNDRFVAARDTLQLLFSDVDFSEFHFNKHMLRHLRELSPERYKLVELELQQAWLARMKSLVGRIEGKIVLLALSKGPLSDQTDIDDEPMHVTQAMLDQLHDDVSRIVTVHPSAQANAQSTDGLIFDPQDAPAARAMLGELYHQEIADTLEPIIRALL